MALCRHYLPGFRATCLGVGGLFALLGASELAQGVPAAMAGFGVPEVVLTSAHYQDAMTWVFVHLLMKGLIIATMGHFAQGERTQRAFARLMAFSVAVFLAMDLHTSDSAIGTRLYAGPRSLVPPVIDVVVLLLFLHLSFCKSTLVPRVKPTVPTGTENPPARRRRHDGGRLRA